MPRTSELSTMHVASSAGGRCPHSRAHVRRQRPGTRRRASEDPADLLPNLAIVHATSLRAEYRSPSWAVRSAHAARSGRARDEAAISFRHCATTYAAEGSRQIRPPDGPVAVAELRERPPLSHARPFVKCRRADTCRHRTAAYEPADRRFLPD